MDKHCALKLFGPKSKPEFIHIFKKASGEVLLFCIFFSH